MLSIFTISLSLVLTSQAYKQPRINRYSPLRVLKSISNDNLPINESNRLKKNVLASINNVITTATIFTSAKAVKAIGTLYEAKEQKCVLQDISFNTIDSAVENDAINALCLNTFKPLLQTTKNGESIITSSFGPRSYDSPKTFYPGISTFFEDGGHSTITYKSTVEDIPVNYEKGNGLQYIKIGTEVLRLSKGIERGLEVKYAYGWVDLESPSGIPYEIVVGIARDPLMMICLQVTNLKQNEDFFINILGMKPIPFLLARQPNSQYEQKQPLKSLHLGYGDIGMSILLIEAPKKVKVNPGNVLDTLTIVFDDDTTTTTTNTTTTSDSTPSTNDSTTSGSNVSSSDNSENNSSVLPSIYTNIMTNKKDSLLRTVYSPDGYKFNLIPYSEYKSSI